MKKILYALILAHLMMSCQDVSELANETNLHIETPVENEYMITADSALAYLESFMAESEDFTTRSSSPRVVRSITPIKYSVTTRADQDSLNCETLLYVANFEQGQGYAILAGDTRIEEKVIAVADEGQLSDATVYSAIELANEERIIIDGYPTTGPGFFTTPETGSELFMNPNTVSLYDETKNDTLVGNFSLDDKGTENGDEDDFSIDPDRASLESVSTPEYVTSSLCVSYAIDEIKGYERRDGFLLDNENGNNPALRTETTKSAWSVKKCMGPILSDFSDWSQDSPFNDLYPEKRRFIKIWNKQRAPAGCFPLAISKILTFFKYPDSYTFNGYTVNWDELRKSYKSTAGKQSAAYLLRGISSACNSWYFYEGTFTFPSEATSFMRFIGLNNAHSHSYSFDKVTGMIDNGCPLIIYSVPGINVTKSHSWNIDGYKIKERTVTNQTYEGNTLKHTTVQTETCKMVHCDFGWKGRCNGYYVSGIFKLNDSNIEHDPNTSYGGSRNYNNLLKVITYDKP